jgi:hypothetical protein
MTINIKPKYLKIMTARNSQDKTFVERKRITNPAAVPPKIWVEFATVALKR